MIRYSKSFTRAIQKAAETQVRHGRGTHFLFETQTMQTRLQKAIRQRVRLLSKRVPEREDFGKFGGGSTLEKLNQARALARTVGEESSEYFLDKCGSEAGGQEYYLDAADAWWEQEIQVLQIQAVKAKLEARIDDLQKSQDERYKIWLVSICVGGVAVAFLIAMYAVRYL